ncbi:MAG TPA: chorismate synthase [Flavobacteriales bacterium]|nr:chorismate synthase [Flavobacteriales bacterium]
MPGNTIGQLFRLTTFGESHGAGIGGVVDGCPAGLRIDLEAVQHELDRRRPGSTTLGTARKEPDRVEVLSGVYEGMTMGTPIAFVIRNADARSRDYDALKEVYRPGHADKTWEDKYGVRDHRGGGRSSARETAARVVGGAIARQVLNGSGVQIHAHVSQVGAVRSNVRLAELDFAMTWSNAVRTADPAAVRPMTELIEEVRADGDSIGGRITCSITGVPAGLGDPVFDKLHADLGKAMLSINAVKGFAIGNGFDSIAMRGSENNDAITPAGNSTNRAGGIQGGISNGEDIIFEVAFKPVSTIAKAQDTVDRAGKAVVLEAAGRHDPCVVPRAVPIVEAMACLVLVDHLLRQRTARL